MRASTSLVLAGIVLVQAVVGHADAAGAAPACAADAIGTARTLVASPAEFPRLGATQYPQTLPLQDKEVVLTFDDGPLRPYTDAVLKELAAECVKATFFLVGRQASAYPDLVQAIANAGHTIGTHSQNHPLTFNMMPFERARSEIDDGIVSVTAALGRPPAPYFRIPGLLRTPQIETHLEQQRVTLWSTDFDADDWYRTATPADIVQKAMARLDAKGRGILLLHDVQPATALALPLLMRELKARGYRIVHVVPEPEKPAVVADRAGIRRGAAGSPTRIVLPPRRPTNVQQANSTSWTEYSETRDFGSAGGGTWRSSNVTRHKARTTERSRQPVVHYARAERRRAYRDYPPPRLAERGWDVYRR